MEKYIEMFEVLLGQKFIYTQHWHGCQGKFGVLIICLDCSFSRVEWLCIWYIFNNFKKQDFCAVAWTTNFQWGWDQSFWEAHSRCSVLACFVPSKTCFDVCLGSLYFCCTSSCIQVITSFLYCSIHFMECIKTLGSTTAQEHDATTTVLG